ncbi:MAG: hypothetical protein ACFCGT_06800 [Sandaracinaceae bacterium]
MPSPAATATVVVFLVALLGGCDPSAGRLVELGRGDGSVSSVPDADRDAISDRDEGAPDRDSDGDGTPDYLDEDADGDGIPDREEAGDADPASPPFDSDGDGEPDYLDLDADDNGIPDAEEGRGDADDDGVLDAADLDDDGDGVPDIREIGADPSLPVDTDDDGVPNFRDVDSDNDTIADRHERDIDSDRDGTVDLADLDTDDDGIPDAEEAGDDRLETPPVDTDGDRIPDYRDLDSDDDGLSDRDERLGGTLATSADTDGDGVSDLVEVVSGTDPTDDEDNPRTRGDFVFVVPFEEDPRPTSDTLRFRTNIQLADAYFLFDRTTSMRGEIQAMRDAVVDVIDRLTCEASDVRCSDDEGCGADEICGAEGRCVEDPALNGCVQSIFTGAGYYGGGSVTTPIGNAQSVQGDASVTVSRIDERIPIPLVSYGGDEAMFQSAECMADPTDADRCPPARLSGVDRCATSGVGCPGFRPEAIRILVQITDEQNELTDGRWTATTAGEALADEGIVFVGIDADATMAGSVGEGGPDLRAIAVASGSLDSAGEPLVFAGDEDNVDDAVAEAIVEIANARPIRVTIEAVDEPDDAGDALVFIARLVINRQGDGCTDVERVEDTDADGFPDAFPALVPGTPVCWDVVPRRNDTVAPTEEPQLFRARLVVRGNDSPLDERVVFFLVPPQVPDLPDPG